VQIVQLRKDPLAGQRMDQTASHLDFEVCLVWACPLEQENTGFGTGLNQYIKRDLLK
jgi:hypothetical protein